MGTGASPDAGARSVACERGEAPERASDDGGLGGSEGGAAPGEAFGLGGALARGFAASCHRTARVIWPTRREPQYLR